MRTVVFAAALAASACARPSGSVVPDVPPLRAGAEWPLDVADDVQAWSDDEDVAAVVAGDEGLVIAAVAPGETTLRFGGGVEGEVDLTVHAVDDVQPTLRGTYVFAADRDIAAVRGASLPFCTVFYGGEELLFGAGGASVAAEDGDGVVVDDHGDGCFDVTVHDSGAFRVHAPDATTFRVEAVEQDEIHAARLIGPALLNTWCLQAATASSSSHVYGASGSFAVDGEAVGVGTCISSAESSTSARRLTALLSASGSTLHVEAEAFVDTPAVLE